VPEAEVIPPGIDLRELLPTPPSERDRLSALKVDLHSDVERLGSEPAIRKEALDAGLGQLGAPVILPAR